LVDEYLKKRLAFFYRRAAEDARPTLKEVA